MSHWKEPTIEQLQKWIKEPFINPVTSKKIQGNKLTPVTAYLRDQCLKNKITPPFLEKDNNTERKVKSYREKVGNEKIDVMYEIAKNVIQWSKSNELPENEPDNLEKRKLLESMKVDLYHSVFASKF